MTVDDTNSKPALPVLIGGRLRDIRKARGLTLKQLGSGMGTTPQTVQRLEMAEMTISLEWIEKFCTALDIGPEELFSEEVQRIKDRADSLGPGIRRDAKVLLICAKDLCAGLTRFLERTDG